MFALVVDGIRLIICLFFFPKSFPGTLKSRLTVFGGGGEGDTAALLFVRSNSIMARPKINNSPKSFTAVPCIQCSSVVVRVHNNNNNNNDITLSRMRRGIKTSWRVTISFCSEKGWSARCRALISKSSVYTPPPSQYTQMCSINNILLYRVVESVSDNLSTLVKTCMWIAWCY